MSDSTSAIALPAARQEDPTRLLVIGGSDAGISAALRARELNPAVEVRLIVADAYPNFSICGLPFYRSGEISDWRTLAHRTREEIEVCGIQLHLDETAIAIDPAAKRVMTRPRQRQVKTHPYHRLVIATGAVPVKPAISGFDLPNVFVLHMMEECFSLYQRLEKSVRSAVIVGAGYIGLEMADALRHRGIAVTLIEQLLAVMRTVDRSIAQRVASLLRERGVTVRTSATVNAILETNDGVQVQCTDGSVADCELVLVVVVVRPQSELAQACGIRTKDRGAIIVDRGMRTNLPDVFAAGDCTATWHRLRKRDLYMPLGTTSHKQGRIAGENAQGASVCSRGPWAPNRSSCLIE